GKPASTSKVGDGKAGAETKQSQGKAAAETKQSDGNAAAKAKQADGKAAPDGQAEADDEAEADDDDKPAENPLLKYPHLVGPKLVGLGHNAEIDLPAGLLLFEQAQAQELMRRMGNSTDGVVALVAPPEESSATWMIVIDADDVGYVSDSDADELDADSMFEQFKEGTAEQNKKRVEVGVPALTLDGWTERPHY